MGLIEDHEARIAALEVLRRDVSTEVAAKITQFESDLAGQARRVTALEGNDNSPQHEMIVALGRRAQQLEVSTATTLNTFSQSIDELGKDTRQWVDEVRTEQRQIIAAFIEEQTLLHDESNRTTALVLTRLAALYQEQADRRDRVVSWQALPWWRRLWKLLRGEFYG